jgi:branched-chain amino acid transport system ATP-binding protein
LDSHLLEVSHLDVFYGDAQAIWDVSFRVQNETIIALVGANGAGKTTILNTISGLNKPKTGEIIFSGAPLTGSKPEEMVEKGISLVPEGRRLFTTLTVSENLELGAFVPKARLFRHDSMERAIALFPALKNRLRQPAGSLSGGEQQMLAIARALMSKPTLLMLDEPSLGLAPLIVKLMFKTIHTLNQEKVTILMVEQNVLQTLELADYVYVLQTGRLTLEGKREDLSANQEFQKAYLGIMG